MIRKQVFREHRHLRDRLQGLAGAGFGLHRCLGDAGDRDVDLLDRSRLLLGGEFDLARCICGGGDEGGDLLERRRDVAELPGAGIHRLRSGFGRHDCRIHSAADVVDQGPHFLGRAADPVGELADFLGDNGEPFAGVARARRLDCRVDGQDIGLLGQLGDDVEDRADFL